MLKLDMTIASNSVVFCYVCACCAGVEGGIVVAKCENKDWGYGYNAANSEYCDLLEGGVLDPAKVID